MPETPRDTLVRKMVGEGTSDEDIRATLKAFDAQPQAPAAAPATRSTLGTIGDYVGDVAVGAVKGAASTVAGLGSMAGNLPNVFDPAGGNLRQAVDTLYGKPGISRAAFNAADEMTTATNTPQMVGKGLETVAELALPVGMGGKAVMEAIPTTAKAGAKFQSVMGAARNIPVVTDAPGEVGLRIMQLAERGGGSLPRPVSQFLQRITHPDKAPMAYEEARDFASGISRLSANEFQRMGPAVAREVAGLRVTLNKAVADAAGKAGKGAEYAQAMNEYAKAMRLKHAVNEAWTSAKRVAPYATAAGAGTWLTTKLLGLLRDE